MKAASRRLTCFLLAVAPFLMAADGEDPLRFVRVHVPHGNLSAIDLGGDRYVPMSAAEFEAALARLERRPSAVEPLRGATPLLDLVRYDARLIASAGTFTLLGTATWTVESAAAAIPSLSLGTLAVQDAQMTTRAGTGDAVVFGRADGSLAISTPQPGTYSCQWNCPVTRHAGDSLSLVLPIVPALASTIRLRLPVELVPIVSGAVVRPDADADDGSLPGRGWQIDIGPRAALEVRLASATAVKSRPGPRLMTWMTALIVGQQIRVSMLVEPDVAWQPTVLEDGTVQSVALRLAKPPSTRVTAVRLHGASDAPAADGFSGLLAPQPQWQETDAGASLSIQVPSVCLGRRQALIIEAVAPLSTKKDERALVTLLEVSEEAWAGGGIVVQVDPAQVIADVAVERAAVVDPGTASAWRAPRLETPGALAVEPPRIYIEQQGPRPRVEVAVERRVADVSVRRVSIVDVSPEAVLARTTCDVTVQQGEAFELRGWLTKGWFIDTVELVSAPVRPPLAAPLADAFEEPPEWRVVRRGEGNELRVAFTSAVTPAKPVMLRITGHRAGIAVGVPFSSAELDMVTLRGEGPNSVLAVRTGAEMTIDTEQKIEPVAVADPRLALLLEDSGVRVRIPVGRRGGQQALRLARRRPPLDVNTEVRLTSRDGRLIESFTFECTPERNEIDSIIVHFSTVMDDRLEWQLLPPATGTVVARRIDLPERRGAEGGEPVADSWLVELTPAARQPVTVRAACTVGFSTAVPIPLAWVDGATKHQGTVTIREAGRFRPRVINHRLSELPPRDEVADQAYATVAEFSYDTRRVDASDLVPAAELLPGGGSAGEDARAWAWREQTTIWSHAAGATEYETRFDIENHGRANVAFTLPPGLQLQGAVVDGQLVRCVARGTGGGDVAIELPPGRRSLQLTVRAMVRQPAEQGWWPVEIQGGSLDVPVLQRDVRVLLAPDVEIVWRSSTHRVIADAAARPGNWPERLLGASWRWGAAKDSTADSSAQSEANEALQETVGAGYREYHLVPVVGRRDGGKIFVADARFVWSASIVVAAAALLVTLVVPPTAAWPMVGLAVVAAVGSLWLPAPFDGVTRAAWWGLLVGSALRYGGGRRWLQTFGRVAATCLAALVLLPDSTVAVEPADDLLRVFLTPVDPNGADKTMALVPEALFRRLVRDESQPVEARVLACTVTDPGGAVAGDPAAWRMVVDVDADAGSTLVVDQRAVGGRVRNATIDGRPVSIGGDGTVVRISLVDPGRHRVECSIEPGRVRSGQVELLTIAVPVAPRSMLLLSDSLAVVADCERSLLGGPFLPAAPVAGESRALGRFDISQAAAVRVVRPVDPRLQLASTVRSVESRNDLIWDVDACRLNATFFFNRPNEIVRSFIVRVDPGTASLADNVSWHQETSQEGAVRVVPLGGARYLVERIEPQAGGFTVRLTFRMPLLDPVGVFGIPAAWIEDVGVDSRLTQLVPASNLTVDVRLPDNATAAQRDVESSLQTLAWRTDSVGPLDPAVFDPPVSGSPASGTITVRRRQPDSRATQRLALEFSAEQIGMELQARIDASDTPLAETTIDVPVDAEVDRVNLFVERFADGDAEAARPIDICWSRVRANQLRVVVQQPRTGRFRLEAEARVEGRASNRGTVAVMRADIAGTVPLAVAWTSRDGRGVAAVPIFTEAIGEESGGIVAGDRVISGGTDLLGGELAIYYERGDVIDARPANVAIEPTAEELDAAAATVAEQRRERVELADVSLVLDQRGRCWGSVRFDVVTGRPLLRLSLPAGLRLFETLVDGRPANAVPRDEGTWEIPLLTTRWPRSVLAVFAGDMGSEAGDGKPFEIGAPVLDGLPCMRMLWTVRTPEGEVLRVADSARVVAEDAYRSERAAAFDRLASDFRQALETASGPDRLRLEEFLALRSRGELLTAEKPWVPDFDVDNVGNAALYAVIDAPMKGAAVQGLALRVGRRIDPTIGNRAVATLLLVAAAAMAWKLARHWPDAWTTPARCVVPAAAALAGVAWCFLLEPWWPGVLLLAAAAVDGLPLVCRWRRVPLSDESTIAQFATPSGGVIADLPSTQQILLPPR